MLVVSSKSYRFNKISNKILDDVFTEEKKERPILKFGTTEKNLLQELTPGLCV